MKRTWSVLGLLLVVTVPAAAQWSGMPVWNSPKGGTGLTISGDYGHPSDSAGGGHAWGGRASLGLSTITFTAGVVTWKPSGAAQSFTSLGGNVGMRLIGGTFVPLDVNLQVGAAHTDSANGAHPRTAVTGAVGFSLPLPGPGFNLEPYFSPGIRYTSVSGSNSTEFGFAIGANVGLGLLGVHLAYDHQNVKNGPSASVFGVGAHLDIKLPLGM